MYVGGLPVQGFLNSWLLASVLLQHEANGIDFHVGRKDQFVRSRSTCNWQRSLALRCRRIVATKLW